MNTLYGSTGENNMDEPDTKPIPIPDEPDTKPIPIPPVPIYKNPWFWVAIVSIIIAIVALMFVAKKGEKKVFKF